MIKSSLKNLPNAIAFVASSLAFDKSTLDILTAKRKRKEFANSIHLA